MINQGLLQRAKQLGMQAASNPRLASNPLVQQGLQRLMTVLRGDQQQIESASMQPNASLMAKVRLIFDLSARNPTAFVNYLRQIDDPELNQLVQNPAMLDSIVRKLFAQGAGKTSPAGDGFPPPPLQSSNVAGFKYDPRSEQLQVKFHNGSIYQYFGVPRWVYKEFSTGNATARTKGQNRWGRWFVGKNPSLGASVWKYLRESGLPYQRLR